MLLVTRRLLLALQGNAKEELIQLATVPSPSRRRISRQDCGSPGIYPGPEKTTAIASSQESQEISHTSYMKCHPVLFLSCGLCTP